MPAGTRADFKIYNEEYFGGQYERLAQNLVAFNAASNGALVLTPPKAIKGDFEKNAFMKMVAGVIRRRDPSSLAPVPSLPLTQGEFIGVKVARGIGPVEQTRDAWKKISEDPQLFSYYIGHMIAEQKLQDMVNLAISSAETAVQGQAALNHSVAATITHTAMVDGMAKLGDQAGNIAAFVMHSKPYFDLVKQAIVEKIFGVANVAVYQGTVATLGKPTIVIDSPALIDAGAPNTYNTLGLVSGAVEVTESESETLILQQKLGGENITDMLQGEYSLNLKVKGFKWNTAVVNPTDAQVATAANWVKEATSDKHLAGVRLVTQ